MGRLTYLKEGRPCVLVNGAEITGPVAERLHAYEETGYEPGEVHDLADRIGKLLLEKGQRQLEIAIEADQHVRIEQTILQHPISWKDIADMAECFAPIIALTGGFNKEYFWNVASAYAEGLLLFLPVAVGGTLYAPWSDPQEGVEGVDKITVEAVKLWTGEQDYDLEDVGRYIFTTREAAEAALKGAADGDTQYWRAERMDEIKYGDVVFHPGDYIIYRNGDSYELGRIKSLRPDGAFVAYHSSETGAKTPYDVMHPLRNAYTIEKTTLGGDYFKEGQP